jgi:hypothetical protein
MTQRSPLAAADSRADLPAKPGLASTWPLACWLAVQLGAVLLAVSGIPLAAHYPEPAERLAAHWVMGTQVVTAGLLFPFLLRDLRTSAQVIASAWPFQLAAGYLSAVEPAALASPAMLVTGWLVALATCRAQLRTPRTQAAGVAAATLLTLGCAALGYLRLEFAGADGAPSRRHLEDASPLLSTFDSLEGLSTLRAWILLTGILVISVGFAAARRISGRPTR